MKTSMKGISCRCKYQFSEVEDIYISLHAHHCTFRRLKNLEYCIKPDIFRLREHAFLFYSHVACLQLFIWTLNHITKSQNTASNQSLFTYEYVLFCSTATSHVPFYGNMSYHNFICLCTWVNVSRTFMQYTALHKTLSLYGNVPFYSTTLSYAHNRSFLQQTYLCAHMKIFLSMGTSPFILQPCLPSK